MNPDKKVKIELELTSPINDDDEPESNNYNKEINKPKSKKLLIIGISIIVLVLIIAAVVIIFITKGGDNEKEKGTDNEEGSDEEVPTDKEIIVLEQVNVAHVASTGKTYNTIADAMADVANEDTITLLNNATTTSSEESYIIESGKTLTLNLNGKVITTGKTNTFINNGTFHIIDNSDSQGGIQSGASTIIQNNGSLTIEKGVFEIEVAGSTTDYKKVIDNSGTMVINGGDFIASGSYSRVIANTDGNITINSANITQNSVYNSSDKGCAIYNDGNGTITINSTESQNENTTEYSTNISGEVFNYGTGRITIANAKIENKHGINTYAIYNDNLGTIEINGGEIISSGKSIYNNGSGIVNIDGTARTQSSPIKINTNYSYGTTTIDNNADGEINIKGHVSISSSVGNSAVGINNNSSGTITIGDKNNITNNVKINSSYYGIRNINGTLNYYGGTITAKTPIDGYITEIANGYTIKKTTSGDNKIYEIDRWMVLFEFHGSSSIKPYLIRIRSTFS